MLKFKLNKKADAKEKIKYFCMKTLKNKFASTPVKIQLRAKNQDTVALPETKTDIQKKPLCLNICFRT